MKIKLTRAQQMKIKSKIETSEWLQEIIYHCLKHMTGIDNWQYEHESFFNAQP